MRLFVRAEAVADIAAAALWYDEQRCHRFRLLASARRSGGLAIAPLRPNEAVEKASFMDSLEIGFALLEEIDA